MTEPSGKLCCCINQFTGAHSSLGALAGGALGAEMKWVISPIAQVVVGGNGPFMWWNGVSP